MKNIIYLLLLSLLPVQAYSQPKEIRRVKKILNEYFEQYTLPEYHPYNGFQADSLHIYKRNRQIHIYPNESFYSQPLTPERVAQIKKDIKHHLPAPYNKYHVFVYGKHNRTLDEMVPNYLRKGDEDELRLWNRTEYKGNPWVTNLSLPYTVEHGLAGRHLMITPSHGRYFKFGEWRWQRPFLFCTTEDLFTQSFVFPFLIPMLEKAGAVVVSARERDIQSHEAIVDNDVAPLCLLKDDRPGAILYASPMGTYQEADNKESKWSTIPAEAISPLPKEALDTLGTTFWAFARPEGKISDNSNPFRLGTARQIPTTANSADYAAAIWQPNIPAAGNYAVYVSYASLPNSIDDAHYIVYHNGGSTEFRINQKIGGGTWVYLGNFEFSAGQQPKNRVVLTNESNQQGMVTADAIRFGGGFAQTVRDTAGISNLPRYLEASRYYAQWSGMPDSLYFIGDGTNDYSDDIRSRSSLQNYIGGGSCYMPEVEGLKVPIEMGIGLHSDAGIRRDNTIYGTMSICTTVKHDTVYNYPSGISRMAAMDLSNTLLNKITGDMTKTYNRTWTRRELWDRNYGEARTPEVPSVILEMLSHQNFEDLKYGHDPNFKFNFSRSVYKAILQYVNQQHGIDHYTVQPLPVHNFSALLNADGTSATLRWSPTEDALEKSAAPTKYILYTRTGDNAFDNGQSIGNHTEINVPIVPNVRYDFKITAVNAGGESFPSEVLSVYRNNNSNTEVLIVNGFERVSGPARIETPDSVGFDLRKDIGVPYHYNTSFCGAQIDFNPAYAGQEGPGALGFCGEELTGKTIVGNTFDYAAEHGRAISAAERYSYSSISRGALIEHKTDLSRYKMIDYIAGLEKDADYNLRPYKTFTPAIQQALTAYLKNGGSLFVSGAYIASDMQQPAEQNFTRNVLKYEYAGNAQADSTDTVVGLNLEIPIYRTPNDKHYAAQAPDAILPTSAEAFSTFLYGGGQGAGIAYPGKDYRVLAIGFPFECIRERNIQVQAMDAIIRFLTE